MTNICGTTEINLIIILLVFHQGSEANTLPGPIGPTLCKNTALGTEYSGTLNVTQSGRQCQAWASQSPQKHDRLVSNGYTYPDGTEYDAMNYCRNPDDTTGGPWCYTVDPLVRWEYCDVRLCSAVGPTTCKDTTLGKEYHGLANTTVQGIPCQPWGSQTPQSHDRTVANGYTFPDGNEFDAKNYCRNPDNEEEGPWCYTMDPSVRWQTCGIKYCSSGRTGNELPADISSWTEGVVPEPSPSQVIGLNHGIACSRLCYSIHTCKGFTLPLNVGPASSVTSQKLISCQLYDVAMTSFTINKTDNASVTYAL